MECVASAFLEFFTWLSIYISTPMPGGVGREKKREMNEKKLTSLFANHCLETAIPSRGHNKAIAPPLLGSAPKVNAWGILGLSGLHLHPQSFQVKSQRQLKSFTPGPRI